VLGQPLATGEHGRDDHVTKIGVRADQGHDGSGRHGQDGSGLADDRGGVQAFPGEHVQLGHEVAGATLGQVALGAAVAVHHHDPAGQDDEEVVAAVTLPEQNVTDGGGPHLPVRP
jgi:hypothetical protein